MSKPEKTTDLSNALSKSRQLFMAGNLLESRQSQQRAKEIAGRQVKSFLADKDPDVNQGKSLVSSLKALNDYGSARRILTAVRKAEPADVWVAQQLALSTYKDEEQAVDSRLAEAVRILDSIGLRHPDCRDPETLGLGGAVYKRRWERTGIAEDLQTALYFYRKAWTVAPERDQGYAGVNAAYVLEVLAYRSRILGAREGIQLRLDDGYLAEARELRLDMLTRLPQMVAENDRASYWYTVTMAEITFGLAVHGEGEDSEKYAKAEGWLRKAQQSERDEWQVQTTARQLVSIAHMRDILPPAENQPQAEWHPAWRALAALLGDDARAAFGSHRGKVGLALSGGGFRASLFHLGVLARLAECDALRSVETLSTVSGGSIVGAHYYLALQNLLESRPDADILKKDYADLVRAVMTQFFDGVQQDLRARILTNLVANWRMFVRQDYTRSKRIGELYERHLYSQVNDKKGTEPRKMPDLLIHPMVQSAPDIAFKPKFSNWRRRAKVPTLLLNSTSLNSSHSWHFTASWMGEPPGLLGQEVDMNERYRRLYYPDAPTKDLQEYRLGYAVAASAGVPALLDPLVISGLYPDRTVKLVDGGVHDNQGISGLLDEACSLILCSDASGQMDDKKKPGSNLFGVLVRTDTIFQSRLREAQYQDVAMRTASNALQGLFFIHMKQNLETPPVDWVNRQDPSPPQPSSKCTPYGVDRTVQQALSEIRTDLDSFSEVEAYALMGSGYLMTERQLKDLDRAHRASGIPGTWGGFDIAAPRQHWPFSPILPMLSADPDGGDRRTKDLQLQLSVASQRFFKVWLLVPWLKALAVALGVAAAAGLILLIRSHWSDLYPPQFGLGSTIVAVGLFLLGVILPVGRWFSSSIREFLHRTQALAAILSFIAFNIHVHIFDPIFERRGSLERLLNLK